MPGGKTHELINITALVSILAVFYYLSTWPETGAFARHPDIYEILVFSVSYIFATFFLSPDLDTKSRPYKRWKMLRILWWPYRIIFKHRGFSHNMILGPLTILVYLTVIVLASLLLSGVGLQNIPIRMVIASTAGIVLSVEIHIISDRFFSKVKSIL